MSVLERVDAIPLWITVLIVIVVLTVTVLLWLGATRVAARLGLPKRTQRRISTLLLTVPPLYLLLAPVATASLEGWLPPLHQGAPNVGTLAFILAPLAAGLLLLRWHPWRQVVEAVPQAWLVGVQFYRNIGAVFLVLMSMGILPAYFAVPAGYGDLLSGLPTLLVAYLIARDWRWWRQATLAINLVGILDFVVAVGIGSGVLHNLWLSQALYGESAIVTAPFAYFPLALIPFYVVPIGLVLHSYSLFKLAWEPQESRLDDPSSKLASVKA